MGKKSKKKKKERKQKKEEQKKKSDDDVKVKDKEGKKAQQNGKEEKNQKSEKEELEKKVEEANNKFLRLLAEFENYKKRTKKERMDFAQLANKDLMATLLPVLDDMERARGSMEDADDLESLKEGLNLVFKKLKEALQEKGLKEMESIGKKFDPEYHEAVSNMPVDDKSKKGKVIDEVEKGYMLNDKIIRHAKVVVGE